MSEKKKKRFKMPHSFVIVFTIIVAAVAMTWILPAGEYVRIENADGIKVIDPTQFQYLERSPVNPLLIPMYIVKAFVKRVDLMLPNTTTTRETTSAITFKIFLRSMVPKLSRSPPLFSSLSLSRSYMGLTVGSFFTFNAYRIKAILVNT